jgi:hypothetical protein
MNDSEREESFRRKRYATSNTHLNDEDVVLEDNSQTTVTS